MLLSRALLGLTIITAALPFLSAQAPPAGFTYQTLSVGLNSATAMAFLPDGRLLLTERATGNIRQFRDGALVAAPWATVPVASGGSFAEQGLLGIAIDPAFLANGYVYVFYTDPSGTQNRIARLREVGGVGTNLTVLSPNNSIGSQLYHNGGAMVFGHDGKLFIATGDAQGGSNSQNPTSWNGKILRLELPNLSVPANNPTPGSAVYSMGHRNTFGLAIHPDTSVLYQTENGGALMDELNRIAPGANYGWPLIEGNPTVVNPLYQNPIAWYQPTTAPTGCCFYTGENYPAAYRNRLFFADYNMNRLRALTLDATGQNVVSQVVFDTLPGSGYGVLTGPDGNLWFLTNDTGGYGATEIGRYVHANEPMPSAHFSSVSNKTLGASATVCVRASNGAIALPWVSLQRLLTPLATGFGNLWVPADAPLPLMNITTDARAYMGLIVPNLPAFLGSSLHLQSIVLSPSLVLSLSNPARLVIRG